ncbi:MAG: hypothetical protein HC853_17450 [Anaerolineae bacterium]|nr:hypothetical protein [Anaerolineae bacterium]
MKLQKKTLFVVVITICLILMLITLLRFGPELLWSRQTQRDIPAIREHLVSSKSGISLDNVIDVSREENEEVYLDLSSGISKTVTLVNPTLESFTGGGGVVLTQIGNCGVSPAFLALSSDSVKQSWPQIHAKTVKDLFDRYDQIYEFIKSNPADKRKPNLPICFAQNRRLPRTNN